MMSLAYVVVFDTAQASIVIDAVAELGTIWAVGLSVLGIYVYKRSEEKKQNTQIFERKAIKPPKPHYNE